MNTTTSAEAVLKKLMGEHFNENSLESRSQVIKLRMLEIDAILKEWKREFFAEGIERTFSDRLTLEAELASLKLEARVIGAAVMAERVKRQKATNDSMLFHIQSVLVERGLHDVIQAAQERQIEFMRRADEQ